jgi:hypothetical protein
MCNAKPMKIKIVTIVLCLGLIWVVPFVNMALPLTELWGELILAIHPSWCFPFLEDMEHIL